MMLQYTTKALAEVDNFYPWLLQNGMKSSFIVAKNAIRYSWSVKKVLSK